MNKRGAYFFVIDALIGGAIFLISIIVILGSYMTTAETRQSYLIAEDVMMMLQTTKVLEFRNDYIISLISNGSITNYNQPLSQQIAEFYFTDQTTLATAMTGNILTSIIPEQYGIIFSIDEHPIFNRTIARDINESRIVLSSRKIVFIATNQTQFYGPNITELKVWV